MKGTERKVIFQACNFQLMGSDLGPQWAEDEKRGPEMVHRHRAAG